MVQDAGFLTASCIYRKRVERALAKIRLCLPSFNRSIFKIELMAAGFVGCRYFFEKANLLVKGLARAVVLFMTISSFAVAIAQTEGDRSPSPGIQSAPIELTKAGVSNVLLPPGQTHRYQIALKSGDFLHVILEQREVDAVLTLIDPMGRLLFEVDSPIGDTGREHGWLLAHETGIYRIEVRAFMGSQQGYYQLSLPGLRSASAIDRKMAQAFAKWVEAKERGEASAIFQVAAWLDAERLPTTLLKAISQADRGLLQASTKQPAEAIQTLQKAMTLFPDPDRCAWSRALLHACSRQYILLGDIQNARSSLRDAMELANACKDESGLARELAHYADFLYEQGLIESALEFFNLSLAVYTKLNRPTGLAAVSEGMARCYSYLGRTQEARDLLTNARETWRVSGDMAKEATTLTQIGWTWFIDKDYQRAILFYHEAIALKQAAHDSYGEAGAWDRLGSAYRESGAYREALAAYKRSAAIYRRGGYLEETASHHANMGDLYQVMGHGDLAWENSCRALDIFLELDQARNMIPSYFVLGELARDEGLLQEARTAMEHGLAVIESLRKQTSRQKLGRAFTDTRHERYEQLIDLLMEMHARDPTLGHDRAAFAWSERHKARGLPRAVETAPVPAERTRAEAQLQAQINRLSLQASSSDDLAEREALDRDMRRLLMEKDRLQAKTANGLDRDPEPASLETIQAALLDDHGLILAYSLGDSRSFLWEIGRHSFRSHILPPRDELVALGEQVYQLMQKSKMRRIEGRVRLLGAKMRRQILDPVGERLRGKRLIIVSDGILNYIPFGALPLAAATSGSDNPERWLVLDHEITYLPSASFGVRLRETAARRKRPPLQLAVFADPVFQASDERLSAPFLAKANGQPTTLGRGESDLARAVRDLAPDGFPRLAYTRTEMEAILELVPENQSFAATDFNANRERFFKTDFSKYRYIHFATHGLLHPHHQELSGLVLSLLDAEGAPLDGFIRLHELMNRPWPAELITLSACRTALGEDIRGEGIWGPLAGPACQWRRAGTDQPLERQRPRDRDADEPLLPILVQRRPLACRGATRGPDRHAGDDRVARALLLGGVCAPGRIGGDARPASRLISACLNRNFQRQAGWPGILLANLKRALAHGLEPGRPMAMA